MKCERMESAMLAVVDGRATAAERERVETHVAGCGACARRMEEMRAAWSALDQLPGLEPSPGFDARLRARLGEQPAHSRWLGWFPGNLRLVAAVAALVAVAVWISLRPPMRSSSRTPVAAEAPSQEDFTVVKNLPVLEDYDVVANFEALSALPGAQAASKTSQPMD
jgi:anti-sigma factor RsiW